MKQPKLNPSKSTRLKMSKKKRKFRAMTIKERCSCTNEECIRCEYNRGIYACDYKKENGISRISDGDKPYKTKDGKYILIEVKE